MTHPVIERRRAEQAERVDKARAWVEDLRRRLPVTWAVVFGSTARGDFNRWSDIDLLVIVAALPSSYRERWDLVAKGAPPPLQIVAWTPDELTGRRVSGDPIAAEVDAVGVPLLDDV
jgi:predicted nucleotidyltransferase